jgi:cellulose synthase/poly-beta-1,6-N-acetylglucosamine synthase-like glycosyltransferase
MAKLAIGIPCYNEEQHIEGTLLSAIQQLDGFSDLEIFISDNQSIDNSVLKIEGTLDAIKSAKNHVTLTNQEKHIAANENFWHVFDNTDSEFFMWLGGHDQISAGYVYRGVTHMTQCLKTGLFCGAHRAIGEGSAFDNVAKYDFSHDNPVDRAVG